MRREDARIYILAHKPVEYGLPDNTLYRPLQVGSGKPFTELRDDIGDNIANWNFLYAETTGTYYLWKMRPRHLKYVGQCQYRRRLEFEEDFDFDGLFQKYDVITCMPVVLFPNLGSHYMNCHSAGDMSLVRAIIEKENPEYVEDFDQYIMSGKFLFFANGFIMKSEDFDRYCEWLFNILDHFKAEKGWNTPEEAKLKIDQEIAEKKRNGYDGHIGNEGGDSNRYQRQVLGFVSERLLTLWIRHNFEPNKIYCQKYKTYEGV